MFLPFFGNIILKCRPQFCRYWGEGVALIWTPPQILWNRDALRNGSVGSWHTGCTPTMVPTRFEANLPIYLSLSKIWILASPLLTQMHDMVFNSSISEEGAEHDRNVKWILIMQFHKEIERKSSSTPGMFGPQNARCLVQQKHLDVWLYFYSSSRCWDIVNVRDKRKITLSIRKWDLVKRIGY